jgi:hypothetical protein
MTLSAPFSESTFMIPRKAAAVATNLIREIQNEDNMHSSVNKSKDDAAPPAAAAPAVKAKKGSRKKEVATTAKTVVTVGAVEHPQSFSKIIRKHFLKYFTTDEEALRLLILHEVLDDILREHSIQLDNELLAVNNMCHKNHMLDWLTHQFQASIASPAAEDVICGLNRPNYRSATSKPFVEIVKQNTHRDSGEWHHITELIFAEGLRFLLYMAPDIHYILDKRDEEVKERVRRALENHKRNQSKKGTKVTAATTATRASTSAVNISTPRTQREGRPRFYEDSDEETESPLPSKRPKLEHNPALTNIKIGSKLAVYWPGDQCYYGGEVTKYRLGENGERTSFCLDYDDGQEEWIGMCVNVRRVYESLDRSIVITYTHLFVLFFRSTQASLHDAVLWR